MDKKKILIADDEKNMRWALEKALSKEGYEISLAENGEDVINKLIDKPDLIIMDINMPIMDGMKALQRINQLELKIPVIMLTAFGSIQSAIEAMKLGAIDYLPKPFDLEEVKLIIKKALNYGSMSKELIYLRDELKSKWMEEQIIGNSQNVLDVMAMIEKVAQSNTTILILGESGTGKELAARALHTLSPRREKPYIKINCGAIPENLLESELFGHEKGAFTGAITKKIGKFERADQGTIFLDEIGEISPSMQVKLLRVIQEKEFERVGGTEPIKVDLRIVAATNRDLKDMVAKGTFREDLYYRLNVIPIIMPPLRDRKEDISLLVDYFIKKYSKESHKNILGTDKNAMELLTSYSWPGNIRELENTIERAVILTNGTTISINNLPKELFENKSGNVGLFDLPEDGIILDDVEKNFIIQALNRSDGNQTKAAKLLGITRHTLLYRMDKYNINK